MPVEHRVLATVSPGKFISHVLMKADVLSQIYLLYSAKPEGWFHLCRRWSDWITKGSGWELEGVSAIYRCLQKQIILQFLEKTVLLLFYYLFFFWPMRFWQTLSCMQKKGDGFFLDSLFAGHWRNQENVPPVLSPSIPQSSRGRPEHTFW